jgi:hypothetical protein
MNNPYCKVDYCRFPKSHTTKYHSCGLCNQTGHGQVECGNPELIFALRIYDTDAFDINERCSIPQCIDKSTHTKNSHICIKCKCRHPEEECIIQSLDVATSKYNLDKSRIEHFLNGNSNMFITEYIGMGCQLFICLKNQEIMTLFMHQDSHGQYGPNTDDTPILDKFLNGYINGTQEYNASSSGAVSGGSVSSGASKFIKCPICRKDIDVDKVSPIFGSSDKCSICFDNSVEVYFTECGHATICKSCFETLKTCN